LVLATELEPQKITVEAAGAAHSLTIRAIESRAPLMLVRPRHLPLTTPCDENHP
jgi:hypothetical protein